MQRMLEFIGIDPERFQARWVSGSESVKFATVIEELTEQIRPLGPNRKLRDGE